MSEILMGYKGSSFLDTGYGYFFAPYVPIMNTPVVLDPSVFQNNKGILTRYGKKLLSQGQQHYGKVTGDTDGWGIKKKKKVQWNSIYEPMQSTDESM
jgi:hypothetical protein